MRSKHKGSVVGPVMFPIKASAGAGKTHALTEQYLEHLAATGSVLNSVDDQKAPCAKDWKSRAATFADIVAITFTNAAVEELRQRVLGSLKKIALGIEDMAGMGSKQAEQCLDTLLKDMGQMNVRTIDSLLFQIVRSAAPGLRLSPDFQTVFTFEEAVEEELEEFLLAAENGSEANRNLLREVMRCYLESSGMNDSSEDGGGNAKKQTGGVGEQEKKPAREEAKKALFFDSSLLERLKNYLRVAFQEDYAKFLSVADIREKYQELQRSIEQNAQDLLEILEQLNATLPEKKRLVFNKTAQTLLEDLRKGDFHNLSSKYLDRDSVRDALNGKGSPVDDLAGMEQAFAALKEGRPEFFLYQHCLKNAPFVELAGNLVKAYFDRLPEQQSLPGGLMPRLAAEAFNFEYGICDTLCRLGTRLSHFLIDEFQDTTLAQWEALHPLVVEAISRAGSFIWVGDIKQSIFMWAGASPELFDDVAKDPELAAMAPEIVPRTLEYNRRSAAEIVEHNNRFFERLADPDFAAAVLKDVLPKSIFASSVNGEVFKSSARRIANVFKDARQKVPENAEPGGYVNLVELEGKKEEFLDNFAEELMAFLKGRVGRGLAYRDVMVLVRSNDDASYLTEKLAANSMNVISDNSLLLANQPLVEQSCAFLEFLENPSNDIALLTILTGSILADHPVARDVSLQDWRDFAASAREGALYKALEKRYPEIWKKTLEPFFKKGRVLAPYDAVREWLRRMDVEKRFPQEKVFLRSLLEELYSAEKNGVSSIGGFLEYWRENGHTLMAAMPDGIDAVKIMTVHKAKGLAAPVVFVPFEQNALAMNAKRVHGLELVERDGRTMVVNIQKDRTPRAYQKEYERLIVESFDLLYVAFTRPRKELYIYTNTENSEKNLIKMLGKEAGIVWPCGKPPSPAEKVEEAAIAAAEEFYEPQDPPSDEVALPWVSWLKVVPNKLFSGTNATKRGSFLHFCLENMRFTGSLREDVENAWQSGLAHAPFPVDESLVADLKPGMEWLLGFEQVRVWLESGWPEQSLLNAAGETLRADLLAKLPRCMLVLDYKTGNSPDEGGEEGLKVRQKHVAQIKGYMACVTSAAPDDLPVYGLLAYLDRQVFLLVEENGRESLFDKCPLDNEGNRI